MILNEDFFDDNKITDDDIESSSDNLTAAVEYSNPEKWYRNMKSKYSHCLIIRLEKDSNRILSEKQYYIWDTVIPSILKKLHYIFDVYGIEYSEPVLRHYYLRRAEDYASCNFIDFRGYKFITPYKSMEEYEDMCITQWEMCVMMFFDLPEVHTYSEACKFISAIMKCLWNNESYRKIFNMYTLYIQEPHKMIVNGVFQEESQYGFHITQNEYMKHRFRDSVEPDEIIIRILNMFFPEKNRDYIIDELTDNFDTLYMKLKNCFP